MQQPINKATLHLPVGAPVRYQQEDGSWRSATVTQLADTQRSYQIQTSEGQTLRRNRRHIREDKGSTHTQTPHINNTQQQESHTDNSQPTCTGQPLVDEQSTGYMTRSGRVIKPRQVHDL